MASVTLSPDARQQFFDNNGLPLVAGKLFTYIAGTTTNQATYTDSTGNVAHANPIILNASGRPSAGGVETGIYLSAGASYKYVLQTSAGVAVWTQDNINAVPASAANLDITGTAGEALTAGQAVYLSDGSGSKTAGQWYKADSANSYSSSAAVAVGMVPASILISASGTIRLGGSMTGLTSLTLGTTYYVGTAGALTATQPTNARVVGIADSTSTLVLAANPGIPNADNGINDFRLTLTTGTPVTTADVTAATTIYCTPKTGNRIALYDSAGNATTRTSAEFSIAVPATTSTNYDIFAFSNAGVPTLELNAFRNSGQAVTGATNATPIVITSVAHGLSNGDEVYISGVAGNTAANGTWTVANKAADTFELSTSVGNGAYTAATGYLNARASTGKLVLTTTGTYTKTADLTRRYLGSFRTTTVSGQTEDSVTKRYLWNYYNRVPRALLRQESTATWTYTTNTYRQANAAAANQVDVVVGVADAPLTLTLVAGAFGNGAASNDASVGIGEDSTTTVSPSSMGGAMITTNTVLSETTVTAFLTKSPAVGRHFYTWLEKSNQSASGNVVTWVGAPSTATGPNGLVGSIQG